MMHTAHVYKINSAHLLSVPTLLRNTCRPSAFYLHIQLITLCAGEVIRFICHLSLTQKSPDVEI